MFRFTLPETNPSFHLGWGRTVGFREGTTSDLYFGHTLYLPVTVKSYS